MDEIFKRVANCTGFEWDSGNRLKNSVRHGVECAEAEEVFFNRPLFLLDDTKHSQNEPRLHAFGKTHQGRPLALTFTVRKNEIRVISARDQNKKELKFYGFQRKI